MGDSGADGDEGGTMLLNFSTYLHLGKGRTLAR
jgi:hypothetical protein